MRIPVFALSICLAIFCYLPRAHADGRMEPTFSSDKSIVKAQDCFEKYLASYLTNGQKTVSPLSAGSESKAPAYACHRFLYKVDDVYVEGFAIQPNLKSDTKLPAIIFNRGGNRSLAAIDQRIVLRLMLPLAEQGFVVIASQYRGFRRWEGDEALTLGQDEFGGSDVHDVKALLPILDGMAAVDPHRIGMFGISRGGHMTYMAAKENPRIKSIAVWAGVTDFVTDQSRKDMEPLYEELIPNYRADTERVMQERSVLYWLESLNKQMPILLLHGDADARVPVSMSTRLAKKLAERGHPHKLLIYSGDDHGLSMHSKEAIGEIGTWFKATLK